MKIQNIVVIGLILALLYIFIGQVFVNFYFGGKEILLATAKEIHTQCNAQATCPQTLEGWSEQRPGVLRKGSMLYFSPLAESPQSKAAKPAPQTFKLVYSMPLPDHWFEVQGGVGHSVTSGWKSR